MSDVMDTLHCIADNTGAVETVDDLLSCGACAWPAEPSDAAGLIDLIATCGWCLYELGVDGCIAGYCHQSKGGEVGDEMCEAFQYGSTLPLWTIPGGKGYHFFLVTAAYGCHSDEPTDCTSPVIP